MNVKTIRIEHEVNGNQDAIYEDVQLLGPIVREDSYDLTFICTLLINGVKQVRRKFWARFKPSDFDNPDALADRIIAQLKYGGRPEIWGSDPVIDGDQWTEEIIIDPKTAEWFSFLANHKQKLLEAFI